MTTCNICCNICCENKNQSQIFTCNVCKFTNCIECHKTYLLTSTNDAHCMNHACRVAIPYDIFLNKFGEKWIFGLYKDHRYKILWERELSLMPQTVQHISNKKKIGILNAKKLDLKSQIMAIDTEINELTGFIKNPEKTKVMYTYPCPIEKCKGFLDKKTNVCDLCEVKICRKCYCPLGINEDCDEDVDVKDDGSRASSAAVSTKAGRQKHTCKPEMLETFKLIKQQAKPCPTCGEFISKVSGCDQMFCTLCGTAFSWQTGQIEKGIIHNPHAFAFFGNNPALRDAYMNRNNHGENEHRCENMYLPNILFLQRIKNTNPDVTVLTEYYQKIAEFRDYNRHEVIQILEDNENKNLDIRIKFINNEYDEKSAKSILHRREKKNHFKKQVANIILPIYDVAEFIFWSFHDELQSVPKANPNKYFAVCKKYLDMLNSLYEDVDGNLDNLFIKFGYTVGVIIGKNMRYYGFN